MREGEKQRKREEEVGVQKCLYRAGRKVEGGEIRREKVKEGGGGGRY